MGIHMAWLETGNLCHHYLKTRQFLQYSFFLLPVLLSGCSGEPYTTSQSSIVLSPPSSSYDIEELKDAEGACLFSSEFYQDVAIRLALTDGLGRAIGDAPVTVYVDYTANTFSGREALQLYSDINGNGVVDTPDELVSGAGDEAFRSRTRNSNGTLDLLLRINLSCAYRGNLYAFSGPVAAVSSISVNDISMEVDEPGETEQPLVEDIPVLIEEPLLDDLETENIPEIENEPEILVEPAIVEEPSAVDDTINTGYTVRSDYAE